MCVFCHCCIGSLERFYHNSYVLFCNLPQDLISYKSLVLFTSSMLVKVCCIRQPTYAAIHLLDACRSMLYTTADIRFYSPPRCLSKYVVYNFRHTLLLTSSMLVKVCCIQLPTYASIHLLDACQSMLYTTADIRHSELCIYSVKYKRGIRVTNMTCYVHVSVYDQSIPQ